MKYPSASPVPNDINTSKSKADYNNRQKALARLEKFGADSNGAITWEKEMDKHAPMVDSS